ncbi:VanW family protein [Veillonella agrestimuris]|uniref:VanW family protein n=1 Tax=Veillonella agrestimuris TaxID=2941340 RepID=UPI00203AD0C3|nr:VanW family protein [Veillonella agrestimuris]
MNIKRLSVCVLLSSTLCVSGCSLVPISGDITKGVHYKQKDLSGYSRENVRQLLAQEALDTVPITIQLNNDSAIKSNATDLGITLDIDATANALYTYGYEDSFLDLVISRFTAFTTGATIDPIYKLDEVKARAYLTELAKQVDAPGNDARLVIENGVVKMIPSKEGDRIDIDATINALKEQVKENKFDNVALIHTNQATIRVTDADVKPLTTVLASYTTYFDASNRNRTNNIEIASTKITGTLLKPGEVFSFNDVVGERTAEAGFDDAPVMIDGKLVPGIGGGICQVSSTIFNTALLSGMEIVERTPHFEPVSYIPAGLDATVAYGYLDFQFKNPYQNAVYVLSVMNGNELTIYIIGTPQDEPKSVSISVGDEKEVPNQTITSFDPSLTEDIIKEGHPGFTLNTYRHITYGDGSSHTDVYGSLYDPVDTIITKAPAKATPEKVDKKEESKGKDDSDMKKH